MDAARKYQVHEIVVAGGVSANKSLRETFQNQSEFKVYIPTLSLCTDNAVMIAAAGYFHFIRGDRSAMDMDVLPNWPLS
jgi:N6-L-threonylcarbamoyladenine synthase